MNKNNCPVDQNFAEPNLTWQNLLSLTGIFAQSGGKKNIILGVAGKIPVADRESNSTNERRATRPGPHWKLIFTFLAEGSPHKPKGVPRGSCTTSAVGLRIRTQKTFFTAKTAKKKRSNVQANTALKQLKNVNFS